MRFSWAILLSPRLDAPCSRCYNDAVGQKGAEVPKRGQKNIMSKLILDSLEIKNFRAFQHLRIEKLGRVNLIVGKNNVGKSSVLEALWLYATKADPNIIMQLLRNRDEVSIINEGQHITNTISDESLLGLRFLFHGFDYLLSPGERQIIISSSPLDEKNVAISIAQSERVQSNLGHTELRLVEPDKEGNLYTSGLVPSLKIDIGQNVHLYFPLDVSYTSSQSLFRPVKVLQMAINSVIVSGDGLTAHDVASYWDNIVLSDLQPSVLSALRIIAPNITGLNLVGSRNGGTDRVPIVKVSNFDFPVPLRSLGEGMNRMLGIALALVNAKDGMLLIDEVDTGLHYSVLPEMWKLIFEVAHRLNVQVFATSHSWDCIQAFQEAAAENTESEGVLVRLEQRKDGIGAVTFDEQELAIVTREQIEVR